MLEQLRIHRQIVSDLTMHYLEPLDGFHARLVYLAGLHDPERGIYVHARLEVVYGEAPVNEVIAKCHNELFERLLETPLALQEEDLRQYVASMKGSRESNLENCEKSCESWIPAAAPDYLKELFRSNQAALHELLKARAAAVRADN